MKLYTDATPNGLKISIALEELELPYEVHRVYLGGEQFTPEFTALNANNKIPVLVDGDQVVTESGAILWYLAEKTGHLLPSTLKARTRVHEALMFQMASLGPMFGQFLVFAAAWGNEFPKVTRRYGLEVERIFGVMNKRLANADYLGGDDYSIADIASLPWVRMAVIHPAATDLDLAKYPRLHNWWKRVSDRPAVVRGLATPEPFPPDQQFKAFVSATIGLD